MTDKPIVPLNKKRIVILGSSPTILKVDRQSNIGYYESDLLEAVEVLNKKIGFVIEQRKKSMDRTCISYDVTDLTNCKKWIVEVFGK